ncbi:MAG: DNA polymerase IV [Akkermansiaceae bacterium]
MRKIIHIDMDCFYAAVEERENPELKGRPLAVGGSSRRGVICAANYEARKFGVHSAMPGFKAQQLCPQLKMVPVQFDLYRAESAKIREVFERFTELIEPLSLDEAYLDVSHWKSTASAIACEVRAQIFDATRLTASAGIATNKMLAKIASDWNKPNGQFEIKQHEISEFMKNLPVKKLWGVGKRMQEKLSQIGIENCGDLQKLDKIDLTRKFGKWGLELYHLSRGIDERDVKAHRMRKSISKEHTLSDNVENIGELFPKLQDMQVGIEESLRNKYSDRKVRSLVIKLKFADFSRTTAERAHHEPDSDIYRSLLHEAWSRGQGKPVRLVGIGVRLIDEEDDLQMDMFS